MRLRGLREGRLLVYSLLLWRTALGAELWLANRDGQVTATVTVFTRFTITETATVTVTPAAVTSTELTTTMTTTTTATTTTATTTADRRGRRRRKRLAEAEAEDGLTATSTTTVWQFPDATETVTVTATDLQNVFRITTATTRVMTEVNTVTAEITVPASTGSVTNSSGPLTATATGKLDTSNLVLANGGGGGLHFGVVLGAIFGGLIVVIALFVSWYLWAQKRRRERSSEGGEGEAAEVAPGEGGRGVTALLGSVLGSTRSAAKYNTIPNLPAHFARQQPPQLPPVHIDPPDDYIFNLRASPTPQTPTLGIVPRSQPPALRIAPPQQSGFIYEYTFGSPVSSMGDTHTSMSQEMFNRISWPPPLSRPEGRESH